MLPLAWSVSLLLLLSSLSLQALALQGGSLQAVQQRRRQQEDQLMTAAQQLAGQLQRRHGCLLLQPHQHWAAAGCASAVELAALGQGEVEGQPWQLLAYSPEAAAPPPPSGWHGHQGRGRGEVLLRLGDHAAAFALHWWRPPGDGPPQLLGLSERGLRELRP